MSDLRSLLETTTPSTDDRTDGQRWIYPWRPDEDPDYVDPELGKLSDNQGYFRWVQEMREKYGYPRTDHVRTWTPRFREWLAVNR